MGDSERNEAAHDAFINIDGREIPLESIGLSNDISRVELSRGGIQKEYEFSITLDVSEEEAAKLLEYFD